MPQRDAIQVLEKDHRRVRSLLAKLRRVSDGAGDRGALLEELTSAVKEHTTIEEAIFYPAFHEAVRGKRDEKLFYEAEAEHGVVDMLLPEVERVSGESMAFAAKVKVLGELLLHHIDGEEATLFPKARRALGREKLAELGDALESRKQELAGAAGKAAKANGKRKTIERGAERPKAKGRPRRPAKLDLNSAEVEDLTRIEGISKTRARNLVDYRDSHGSFHDWDEVLAVRGISRNLLLRIQSSATIGH